jgi:hypothetical protein
VRRGLGGGIRGSIICHNSSSKIGCAMVVPPCTATTLQAKNEVT